MNPTRDQALWVSIRNRTRAISFGRCQQLLNRLLNLDERHSPDEPAQERRLNERGALLHLEGAYQALKASAETLLLLECGRGSEDIDLETELAVGPASLNDSPGVNGPCLVELIWSYWHEEGMLVATMNAVTERFQNLRNPGKRDPLAEMETRTCPINS